MFEPTKLYVKSFRRRHQNSGLVDLCIGIDTAVVQTETH